MINLRNTTEPQTVAIPLEEPWTFPEQGEAYTFTLRSPFDEVDIIPAFDGDREGDDISEFGHYALLGLTLPEDLPDGSYEYIFKDPNGRKVACGCCTVGDYIDIAGEYEKTISYEQTY